MSKFSATAEVVAFPMQANTTHNTSTEEMGVSVVIATLGGDSLDLTIRSLNSGTVVPAEILVCVPVENASKVAHLQGGTTSIVQTDSRGQVAQRSAGFRRASHELVMQLDDDLLLDRLCLERLAQTLHSLGSKAAVAPALLDVQTGLSVYKKPAKNSVVLGLYYWLMNGSSGYAPGKIDLSGSSIGLDPFVSPGRLHDVEWLAGGCVLHYRENLVIENFWPLPGKAYYEDVVHSSILAANGVRLVIDTNARCSLELFSQASFAPMDFFRNLYSDYLGRRYFIRRFSRQSFRIYLYYSGRILSYLFSRFK
jgi:GT2 family glycosyltransferase